MEGQSGINFDRTVNLVEQMRNQALGLPLLGPQEEQPPPEFHDIVSDTIEADMHIDITLESSRRSRSPSAGPDSSGDEDARGHKRRNRILTQEKKDLMLLAANVCHVKLQARGRDKFWKFLVNTYEEQGGRKIVWSTAKTFFLKEIAKRIEEKENDDTSGREIRHGEYFEHLDMLINRIQLLDQEMKDKSEGRRKLITEQQSAKERAKENLGRSYSQKRQAEDIIDISSSTSEEVSGDEEDEEEGADANGQDRAANIATIPDVENLTPGRPERAHSASARPRSTNNSRSRGRQPKKQKQDEGLFKMINRLARATEGGASELASAIKEIAKEPVTPSSTSGNGSRTTDQPGLIQQINEVREETAQRLQMLEDRQEERQSMFERRQEERQSKLEETNNQILHMLGQLLAQKDDI